MRRVRALRSEEFFRVAASLLLFDLATTVPLVAQQGADSNPDCAIVGGKFPSGWSVRPDRGTPEQIKFTQIGDVYHFAMGPAGTFPKGSALARWAFGVTVRGRKFALGRR